MGGGGKLTARQKMINMMYLVLTALLALNISKEVLHAFIVINIGLMKQKENIEQKNEATLAEFENQVTISKGAPRTKGFRDDAFAVRKQSDELNAFIANMKIEVVAATDRCPLDEAKKKVENPFLVKRPDDYDGTTKYFGTDKPPGDQGKAHELKVKLQDYKKFLLTVVKTPIAIKKKAVEDNLKILDLEVPKGGESKTEPNWETFFFYHQPQVAALAELTKWQNIVRGCESEILTYLYDQISATAFKFDAVLAAIIPKSNFVTSGSNFEAEVFLAAFSSAIRPKITYGTKVDSATNNVVGGLVLDSTKYTADGRGHISIPASGQGEKTCEGIITMTDPMGKESNYIFRTKYNVSPPSANVSADKMNVVYRGLDNPITVSVPGFANNEVFPSCSGGNMSGSNGKYTIKPGTGNELTISVSAKGFDGKSTSMGSYKFRIKAVPTPDIVWGTIKSGGKVNAGTASAQPLIPKMPDGFDFEVYATILSYSGGFSSPSGYFPIPQTQGNKLSAAVASKVKTLPKGTKIFFDNIVVSLPGGAVKTIPSAVFTTQ